MARSGFVPETLAGSDAPLTFGELEVGQRYIGFPEHGDNSGHGGVRGTSYVFMKIDSEFAPSEAVGNAIRIRDGTPCSFRETYKVIRVD